MLVETILNRAFAVFAEQQGLQASAKMKSCRKLCASFSSPRPAPHDPSQLFPVSQRHPATAVTIRLISGQSATTDENLLALFDFELDRRTAATTVRLIAEWQVLRFTATATIVCSWLQGDADWQAQIIFTHEFLLYAARKQQNP